MDNDYFKIFKIWTVIVKITYTFYVSGFIKSFVLIFKKQISCYAEKVRTSLRVRYNVPFLSKIHLKF